MYGPALSLCLNIGNSCLPVRFMLKIVIRMRPVYDLHGKPKTNCNKSDTDRVRMLYIAYNTNASISNEVYRLFCGYCSF